jgi:hypothetical protein
MNVYLKEAIPNRFYYQHSSRIQPIILVAEEGWTITLNKSSFKCKCLSLRLCSLWGSITPCLERQVLCCSSVHTVLSAQLCRAALTWVSSHGRVLWPQLTLPSGGCVTPGKSCTFTFQFLLPVCVWGKKVCLVTPDFPRWWNHFLMCSGSVGHWATVKSKQMVKLAKSICHTCSVIECTGRWWLLMYLVSVLFWVLLL